MTAVVAGAVLGLLGSAHCVGMCGPLVLAVGRPAHGAGAGARAVHVLTYHLGRIATYAGLGLLAGLAGHVVALAGLGRALAVAGGVLLVAGALGPGLLRRQTAWAGAWVGAAARLAARARGWQARHPLAGRFGAGLANGLLPCGMVYAALAAALAAGSIAGAVLTMAAFGAGTIPALAALSLSAAHLSIDWRRRLARAAPVGLAIVGALLIARGLTAPQAADPRAAGPMSEAHRH
jgi:sulfite exporter TauE/SafE